MISVITNIIYKIFNFQRDLNIFLFTSFFHPYYYHVSKYGFIITYKHIRYLYDDDIFIQDFFITYECDKKYQMFNRIIYKDAQKIPNNARMCFASNTIFEKYKNIISFPTHPQLTVCYDPIYTNYIFVNIQLKIFDIEYTIYLRSNDYNFYYVGNKIDYSFICYYIINIMKTDIFSYFYRDMYPLLHIKKLLRTNTVLPYTLDIIDHNFKRHTLNEWDSITFNKHDYIINKTT